MKSVLRFFAAHPTAANLLMLLLLGMGVLAVPQLLRETFPDFDATEVQIQVVYPGASAQDVEEAVVLRIEDALESVTGIEEVRSEAREGIGQVTVEMREGGDFIGFISDIKTEIDAIDDFPEQTEEPVVRELGKTSMVVSLAVSGPMSAPDLKAYCDDLKDRMIAKVDQVSEITVLGFSDHHFRIEIPARTLMQFGLSVSDVAETIASQSVDLPAGTVETAQEDVIIRFTDLRRSVPEYEDLVVVSGTTGAEIRLGDIARITDRFELAEEKVVFNGRRAGMLQINKTDDQDALEVLDAVTEFVEAERAMAPPTMELTLTRNVSKIVRDRLNLLTDNGLQGLVLVFLTMWLFFSFRFSFWVAMGLPVSFAGALFGMHLAGLTLNMLTMVGLLLGIGLIMDDAIVLAENVATHLRKGKTALQAAVDGVSEVSVGVISSFMTTLAVFGSLAMFVAGDIGKVLWVMPVVLILTLGISLIEAFLILPNHLAHSLHGHEKDSPSAFRRHFDAGVEWCREHIVGRFVDFCIGWRYLFVGFVLTTLVVALAMLAGGVLKIRAFPEIDGDVLEARLLMPQGTPLERTEEVVARITDALAEVNVHFKPIQPEQQDLVDNVNIRYAANADAFETGPHVATVTADLLTAEVRIARIDEVIEMWRETTGAIPDVIALTFKEPAIGPGGLPIDIRLKGTDLESLKAAALELQAWLSRYDGVFDLTDDLRPGKREIRLTLGEGATALGLKSGTIARQVRASFHGVTADEVQIGSESYEVDVRLAPEDRDSLGDVDAFHITLPDGSQVPLGAVARVEEGRGWARIYRVDGMRTVTIQGDVDSRYGNANQIIADTMAAFMPGLLERYPDLSLDLEGQAKEGAKTGQSMLKALVVGLFGVFLLLSFQFKSYIEPITVMLAIPLTLAGVVFGHLLMGLELSMVSIMGFISLAGIVVNDSILLVEFIRLRMGEGRGPGHAARQASRDRFRAVLLTSLTTVAGLFPLLLERSLQAQVLIPLVTSIIFGLLTSTLLVLFFVPSVYSIFADFGWTRKPPRNVEEEFEGELAEMDDD
jgi:multidrug efflux pump subunit AcrB